MSKESINKSDLVKLISEETNVPQSQVNNIVSSFCSIVTDSLKQDKSVILVGFGTFTTGVRKERVGRNPQNGKTITIPETKVAKFKPGKSLKESVSK